LHFEGEGTILVGRDDDRDRRVLLDLLGLCVERLAELHDVETTLAQRRPDRRRRVCGARGHLQLEESSYFLRHVFTPLVVRISTAGVPAHLPHLALSRSGWSQPPRYTVRSSRPGRIPVPPAARARRATPRPSRASGPRLPLPPRRSTTRTGRRRRARSRRSRTRSTASDAPRPPAPVAGCAGPPLPRSASVCCRCRGSR